MGFVEKGYVYWIHKSITDNIKTSGYVGITKDVKKRFREHKSTNHNCAVLKNAINKYGDSLIYEVVWEGSYEGAKVLEEYFRPAAQIGWNIRQGGSVPQFGDATKKKMSKSAKLRGVHHNTRSAQKLAAMRKVICITDGKIFGSIKEAQVYYNVSHISEVCRGKRKHTKNLVFKFLEEV